MSQKVMTILGGRGMLGSDLSAQAAARGYSVRIYDLPEFDITDAGMVEEAVSGSDVVINCAAYTNVDGAESEPETAFAVNRDAVALLGSIAAKHGVYVIHLGTDYVFDGSKAGTYSEQDKACPLSVYGKSKAQGEAALLESGCECCVVRIEWTYGRSGNNFIKKILDAAQRLDTLRVVDDQVGSPTHTLEVSKLLCDMIEIDPRPTGIFHLAAGGYVSRYDMVRYLLEKMNIDKKVLPCKTSDFESAAQRPLNSRYDCTKLEMLLGRKIKDWKQMLDEYLEMI